MRVTLSLTCVLFVCDDAFAVLYFEAVWSRLVVAVVVVFVILRFSDIIY